MKRLAAVLALVGWTFLCKAYGLAPASAQAPRAPDASSSTMRSWKLPRDEPPLPERPGRAAFYSACATCHSTRYITDQPRFPREIWASEVDKMTKAYGAQTPPGEVDAIVDYLVAVNGPETK